MTELINPRRCMMAGVGLECRGTDVPRHALLSFQRPPGGADGSRRLTAPLESQKRPLAGGALNYPAALAGLGSSLRGGSLRDPKQERPRSIDRDSSKIEPTPKFLSETPGRPPGRKEPGSILGGEEPREAALSNLEDSPAERLDRQVQAVRWDALAVELDAALGDQPTRLAGRYLEGARYQRGQVDLAVPLRPARVAERDLRDVVGDLAARRARCRSGPPQPPRPARRGSAPRSRARAPA